MTTPPLYHNTRAEAKAAEAMHYFDGKLCRRGHLSLRRVCDGGCVLCTREYARRWRAKSPTASYAITQRWRAKNRDNYLQSKRDAYAMNPEPTKAAMRARGQRLRKEIAAYVRQWQRDNPDKVRSYVNARRAAKLQRLPAWADKDALLRIYAMCPEGMEVDHVIPLRGKLVSGLHVHNNLQYLTRSENAAKLNKFDPADYYTKE